MRKIAAIVQARMGSARLPNKMMLCLHGFPVIGWVFLRMKRASLIDCLIFALPDTSDNEAMALYLRNQGANVFLGPENDVLERFHLAANACRATHVVRVCADNPLISPVQVDRLVEFFLSGSFDYAYNHVPRGNSFPDGLGAEMVTIETLELIRKKAKKKSQREHVFNYIWDQLDLFSIGTFNPDDPFLARPELKLDLDTHADYVRLLSLNLTPSSEDREIIKAFGAKA
ncbi:MAG: spore coat biosynthesis protein F [Candidatus Wallbacteria bacterium]|nr:spore coat biosynthesis protein F [Candidatus Wallbacteria bacterium]